MVVGAGPASEALEGDGAEWELAGLDDCGVLEGELVEDEEAEDEGEDVWLCVRWRDADGAPPITAPQPATHTARLVSTATRMSFSRKMTISGFLPPHYLLNLFSTAEG